MMLSIVTPTYNRMQTLQRLYDSICQQNVQDNNVYEWIVVDDGSSDNTKLLIQNFIDEDKIKIKYCYQENAGKPSAINTGVLISSGNYIFIVDSDDLLTEDAIATLLNADLIAANGSSNVYSGFCFRKANLDGSILGREVIGGEECLPMTATECSNHFMADLAYIFKRDFLCGNKFPKFNNETFVPELYIWNKITDIAPILVYPKKIIYLCEYMEDGLSHNFSSELKKNPKGFGLFYKDQIKREKKIIEKFKKTIRWLQCVSYSTFKLNN